MGSQLPLGNFQHILPPYRFPCRARCNAVSLERIKSCGGSASLENPSTERIVSVSRRDAAGGRQRDVSIPVVYERRCSKSIPAKQTNNLAGDAKGKGASGSNREAENTDAPERGGLLRSSDEAGVMPVERREQVTDVGSGQPATGGT